MFPSARAYPDKPRSSRPGTLPGPCLTPTMGRVSVWRVRPEALATLLASLWLGTRPGRSCLAPGTASLKNLFRHVIACSSLDLNGCCQPQCCPRLVLELVYPSLPQLINLLYVTALQDWTEGRTPMMWRELKYQPAGMHE